MQARSTTIPLSDTDRNTLSAIADLNRFVSLLLFRNIYCKSLTKSILVIEVCLRIILYTYTFVRVTNTYAAITNIYLSKVKRKKLHINILKVSNAFRPKSKVKNATV